MVQQRYQTPEASALLDHKAGEKMYLDFTGQKLHWKDTKGQTYVEEIFLSVLGVSSYYFALPVLSQKQDDFAWAVEQSFVFYGGVPRAVVPDCLKSAVLKNDGHESVINPLFRRLMDHYGTLCLPARPKHPKNMPLIEGAVNLVYRQILARIDGLVFKSRNDMLVWWKAAVGRVNALPFQKLPGSRLSRFMAIDKGALKPLPSASFDLTAVLNQTVATTGIVYLNDDKTSYSVPSSLQGMKVEILVTPTHVEIWHEGERRAMHERQCGAGEVSCPFHRPSAQKWYADRNIAELLNLELPLHENVRGPDYDSLNPAGSNRAKVF